MAGSQNSDPKGTLEQQAEFALERHGDLSNKFEQAENAQAPLEASTEHERPYGGTSVARDVLEQQADNALERYGETSQSFNNVHDNEQTQDDRGRDSNMVSNDRPTHDMRPDPEVAEQADRDRFNDRWTTERQDAKQDQEQSNDGQALGR